MDAHNRSALLTTYITYHLDAGALGGMAPPPLPPKASAAEDADLLHIIRAHTAREGKGEG